MGLLVMVHEDEDVEVFPCRIDGVELARRFLDMAGDPVEGGIVPTAADDLVRLRLRQLVVEPVVAGSFHLAICDELAVPVHPEIRRAPGHRLGVAEPLQDKALAGKDQLIDEVEIGIFVRTAGHAAHATPRCVIAAGTARRSSRPGPGLPHRPPLRRSR